METKISNELNNNIFDFLLRLADDRLILGHRLSEWCGHAPILEEDIALANIALDCIGQANAIYSTAAELEDKGRTADDLAFFRNEREFKNLQLLEQPNEDFAFTIVRQFYYDQYSFQLYEKLRESKYEQLSAIAEKSLKEITYHLRHSRQWILKLGDGTEESNNKVQNAIDSLWIYTDEMFNNDTTIDYLIKNEIVPNLNLLKDKWIDNISKVLEEATLTLPASDSFVSGSRDGRHTEHLGHLLAEMQILPRSFPNAKW
jgi:ring-1,2-phenylacetyl-CoA epoxidase subunit PaaC